MSGVPSRRAKQAAESNAGRHSQSTEPRRETSAAVVPVAEHGVVLDGHERRVASSGCPRRSMTPRRSGTSGRVCVRSRRTDVRLSVVPRRLPAVNERLVVQGAREHNLRNVDLDLPRDKLIVFTGLSGSGKSSLAFDTIFAEGQRRYVESLSAYARQFLGQMDKPDVDFIEGLSPAVSIDQKSTNRNPRSTVGTITEVYDYLRLLFARAGTQYCPVCGERVTAQTPQQIVDRLLELPEGTRYQVLAPVVRGRKGEYADLFKELQAKGFARARVDGEVVQLTEPPTLEKKLKHDIEVVIDRLVAREGVAAPAHRLGRDRARPGRRAAGRRAGRRRHRRPQPRASVLRAPRVPERPRAHPRRDRAAHVLVQRPVRRLPRVHRHRLAARGGPRPGRPRRGPVAGRRRGRPVVADLQRVLRPRAERARRGHGLLDVGAVARAAAARQGRRAARPEPRGEGPLQEPLGSRAAVLDRVRGRHHLPRAPAQRDRLGLEQGEVRGLHARGPVPRVRGCAAQARGARGPGRRPVDRRGLRPAHPRGARVPRRARAGRARAGDRRAGAQGDPGPARVPARRRPRLPLARRARRRRCPAARRSASGWRRRSAPAWSACSTCWTSRRSGCTSGTTAG